MLYGKPDLVTAKLHQIHVSMPALKCSVGIQRKSGSGFQPLRRGKMPRPLFVAEPRNLADIVSRDGPLWPVDEPECNSYLYHLNKSGEE